MAFLFGDTEDRNFYIFLRALSEDCTNSFAHCFPISFLATLAQKIPTAFEEVRKEEDALGSKFPLSDDDLSNIQQMSARLAAEFRRIQD